MGSVAEKNSNIKMEKVKQAANVLRWLGRLTGGDDCEFILGLRMGNLGRALAEKRTQSRQNDINE